MTVYLCRTCEHRIEPGDGYIHSSQVGHWRTDHRECFEGDWSNEYCLAVPDEWWHLLEAHRDYQIRRGIA